MINNMAELKWSKDRSTGEGIVVLKIMLGGRFLFLRWHVTGLDMPGYACCYFILSSGLFDLLTICSASLAEVLLIALPIL